MSRKQHRTQPALPEHAPPAPRPVELRDPTTLGGMTEFCVALATILARVCGEPDAVQSRRIP